MRRIYPGVPFERYADDVVCHCRTMAEAEALKAALEQRTAQCSLALHPQKKKVVYCRDDNRRERFSVHQFDFLGFCFRPRLARSRAGTVFVSFLPAISRKAAKAIRQTVHRWRLHCRHTVELPDLAQEITLCSNGGCNIMAASIVRRLCGVTASCRPAPSVRSASHSRLQCR